MTLRQLRRKQNKITAKFQTKLVRVWDAIGYLSWLRKSPAKFTVSERLSVPHRTDTPSPLGVPIPCPHPQTGQ